MALNSASSRLVTTTSLKVILMGAAFAQLATPFWADQSMSQRVTVAFTTMFLSILVGWLGANWARAARPVVAEPEGIEAVRRSYMKRSRTLFAVLFGVAAAIVGPFIPELAALPIWGSVTLGFIVGALVGLLMGQLHAAQMWIARMPRFAEGSAYNKSLERTRER